MNVLHDCKFRAWHLSAAQARQMHGSRRDALKEVSYELQLPLLYSVGLCCIGMLANDMVCVCKHSDWSQLLTLQCVLPCDRMTAGRLLSKQIY